MGNLFQEGSLFSFVNSSGGAVTLAIVWIAILCIAIIVKVTRLSIFNLLHRVISFVIGAIGRGINKREARFHRDLEIGKINEKRNKVKIYRFLNDLTIDLGLKQRGATPYEFLFIVLLCTFIATICLCQVLFGNVIMVIVMYPIMFVATMCILYTRANVAHDSRIEAVLEAENIICNNISGGVVLAVRSSLNVMPSEVREDFKDFLDNIEHKNYHIKTALMELNTHLGSIADDFIKKCIVFETEEEHGIVGMFQDVVRINTIKSEMRTEMKRRFEETNAQFIMGAAMIFAFLGGVIALYPDIAHFYLKTPIGQIILALDALLLVGEYVYITYLRAKEI